MKALSDDIPTLNLQLVPEGVAAATQRVVVFVAQAVGTSLRALEKDNCEQPAAWGDTFGYQFNGLELPPEERRAEFKNWVLAKGFQDLARGVREGLEEAYFFISMARQPSRQLTTAGKVQEMLDAFRRRAATYNFFDLLTEVNSSLKEPIAFEAEFQSLQSVRNCLEHRGGVVGMRDVDAATGSLTLTFPRLKIFYKRNGEEIELVPGEVIDTQAEGAEVSKEVPILLRRVTRSRTFALGEKVTISAKDFFEIALACQLFASDLASKLPLPAPET